MANHQFLQVIYTILYPYRFLYREIIGSIEIGDEKPARINDLSYKKKNINSSLRFIKISTNAQKKENVKLEFIFFFLYDKSLIPADYL